MRRISIHSALSVGLLSLGLGLSSCEKDDPKSLTNDGAAAMNSGNAKGAVTAYEMALAKMDASNPDYVRASVGRCQALARLDGKKAKDEFLALAKAQTGKIQDQDFHIVVSEYVNSGDFMNGIDILVEGEKMYPESKKLEAIKQAVIVASQKQGDPAVLKKLKGLGYI